MYWGIIAVCSEVYSFIKGFSLYTVFPHVPVSPYSLLSPVVSHIPSSASLSLGLLFVLVPSGYHFRILHDSLFSRILFKYPKRRSSFPTINLIYAFLPPQSGTAVAQWSRRCATNRKVTGSIPAGVIGMFHWHKILPIAL